MKKLFVTLLSLLSFLATYAQNAPIEYIDHMDFNGIAMDGPLKTFVNKMEDNGFQYIPYKSSPRYAIMKGRFLEYICEIAISATPNTDKVYMITATTQPFDESWDALNLNIDYSIRFFEQKYGNYEGDFKFLEPYFDGCGNEIEAIKNDKLITDLFFTSKNGEVILTINNNCTIYYTFYDKLNRDLADKEYEQEANSTNSILVDSL